MSRFLICIFLFTIPILFIVGCNHDDSEVRFDSALQKINKGKYKEAISILDELIQEDTLNINYFVNRAFAKSNLGKYRQALRDYSYVLSLDNRNTLAYFNRGLIYYNMNKMDSSLIEYNYAVQTKGADNFWIDKSEGDKSYIYDVSMPSIRFERGLARYELNKLRDAFDDFDFCIKKIYMLEESYYWRGLIFISYKKYKEGCEDMNQAKSLGNVDADTMINMYCDK